VSRQTDRQTDNELYHQLDLSSAGRLCRCRCWNLWSNSQGTSVTTAPAVSFSVVPNEKMSLADDSSDRKQPASTQMKLYGIRPTADSHYILT